jgi:AbrB family transcriptional regulator (stage V sporulation protein T)
MMAADGIDKPVAVAAPIIAAGDLAGAVILLVSDPPLTPGDTEMKLTVTAANFLAKQMEE